MTKRRAARAVATILRRLATRMEAERGHVMIALAHAGLTAGASDPAGDIASPIDTDRFGDTVLLIAPHPDDETLAPGGLVSELRAKGSRVRVVVLTSGDGYEPAAGVLATGSLTPEVFRELGRLRHTESDSALAIFGVPPEDRIFLCYGDGSLSTLWDSGWDQGPPRRAVNGATAAPYDYAWQPGRDYCGACIVDDLEAMVAECRPTSVVYPDASDTHQDHRATNAFVEYALANASYEGDRYTYLVHFGRYPYPWAHLPAAYLRPPSELLDVGTRWWSLPLTERAETAKTNAVALFRSQLRLANTNLPAFIRRNELFGTYEVQALLSAELKAGSRLSHEGQDIVVHEPRRSGVASILGQPGTVSEVRMVCGSETVWMGISTFNSTPPDLRYDYHLRLFGGGPPSRLDVTVAGTDARASTAATNSVSPCGLVVRRDARTVWVGFRASLLEGRNACLVAGAACPEEAWSTGYASAWRPVRLYPPGPIEADRSPASNAASMVRR